MFRVSFKFKDMENDVNCAFVDFNTEEEAMKFFIHINNTTSQMILKYGRFGIYHPYFNIRIKEIK